MKRSTAKSPGPTAQCSIFKLMDSVFSFDILVSEWTNINKSSETNFFLFLFVLVSSRIEHPRRHANGECHFLNSPKQKKNYSLMSIFLRIFFKPSSRLILLKSCFLLSLIERLTAFALFLFRVEIGQSALASSAVWLSLLLSWQADRSSIHSCISIWFRISCTAK